MEMNELLEWLQEQLQQENIGQQIDQKRLRRQILIEKLKREQPEFREYLELTTDLEIFENLSKWVGGNQKELSLMLELGLLTFPAQALASKIAGPVEETAPHEIQV